MTRSELRDLALAFNLDHPELWADVLATPDQNGATLTFYRRLHNQGIRQFEPIHRVVLEREGGALLPAAPYPSLPHDDEQSAIDQALSDRS